MACGFAGTVGMAYRNSHNLSHKFHRGIRVLLRESEKSQKIIMSFFAHLDGFVGSIGLVAGALLVGWRVGHVRVSGGFILVWWGTKSGGQREEQKCLGKIKYDIHRPRKGMWAARSHHCCWWCGTPCCHVSCWCGQAILFLCLYTQSPGQRYLCYLLLRFDWKAQVCFSTAM